MPYGMVARRAYSYWRRRSWKRAAMQIETDIGWHRRKKRQAVRRSLEERFGASGILTPVAVDIVNNFTNSGNSLGQRAWPEVSGYPPVFGNFIGEIAHTGGGSYIWTGFSWEPAILGG